MTSRSEPPRGFDVLKSGEGWALVISVAFNLLVAGALAGAYFNGAFDRGWHHHWHKGGLTWITDFTNNLPHERQSTFEEILSTPSAKMGSLSDDMDAARNVVRKILRNEPFDELAFKSAAKKVSDVRIQASRTASETFVAVVSAMTVDERKAFLKWRQERRRDRKRKRN